ncbi:MAG: MFS transporter [Maricaulaceae bacterium]
MIAVRLALAYAGFFLVLGASLPFLPLWLAGRGLDEAQIALVISGALVAKMLFGPAYAYWADTRLSRRAGAAVMATGAFVAYAAYAPMQSFPAILAVGIAAGACSAAVLPLIDVVVLGAERAGLVRYPRIRAVGSVCFILANIGCGQLKDVYGSEAVLAWVVAASALLVAAAWSLPGEAVVRQTTLEAAPRGARFKVFVVLLRRPDISGALLASAALQASHAVYYAYSAIFWGQAGLSGLVIGALVAWGVAVEVAFFTLGARLTDRLGVSGLFAVSGIAGLIRWSAYAYEPGLGALVALQTLHAGTFACAHLAVVRHLSGHAPDRLAGAAQSVNSAFSNGAALAGATALAGFVVQAIGAKAFWLMAGLSVLGGVIGMWTTRRDPAARAANQAATAAAAGPAP